MRRAGYRGELYISELLAGPTTVNDKYIRTIRKYCSKDAVREIGATAVLEGEEPNIRLGTNF